MQSEKQSIWKELELGFGSGTAFRILAHLVLNPDKAFTKYALAKVTGLRTSSVENQLGVLLKLNWIKEYAFTPKTYQINLENEVVDQIHEFFQRVKHLRIRPTVHL